MVPFNILVAVCLVYVCLLFLVAFAAERRAMDIALEEADAAGTTDAAILAAGLQAELDKFTLAPLGIRNTSDEAFEQLNFETGKVIRSTPPGGTIYQRFGSYGNMQFRGGYGDDSMWLAERALAHGGQDGRVHVIGVGISSLGAGAGVGGAYGLQRLLPGR